MKAAAIPGAVDCQTAEVHRPPARPGAQRGGAGTGRRPGPVGDAPPPAGDLEPVHSPEGSGSKFRKPAGRPRKQERSRPPADPSSGGPCRPYCPRPPRKAAVAPCHSQDKSRPAEPAPGKFFGVRCRGGVPRGLLHSTSGHLSQCHWQPPSGGWGLWPALGHRRPHGCRGNLTPEQWTGRRLSGTTGLPEVIHGSAQDPAVRSSCPTRGHGASSAPTGRQEGSPPGEQRKALLHLLIAHLLSAYCMLLCDFRRSLLRSESPR